MWDRGEVPLIGVCFALFFIGTRYDNSCIRGRENQLSRAYVKRDGGMTGGGGRGWLEFF